MRKPFILGKLKASSGNFVLLHAPNEHVRAIGAIKKIQFDNCFILLTSKSNFYAWKDDVRKPSFACPSYCGLNLRMAGDARDSGNNAVIWQFYLIKSIFLNQILLNSFCEYWTLCIQIVFFDTSKPRELRLFWAYFAICQSIRYNQCMLRLCLS